MSGIDQTTFRPTMQDRLRGYGRNLLALARSPGFATLNLLLFAVTITVILLAERLALTGMLILLWGAGASWLAFTSGKSQRPAWMDGRWIVVVYAALTAILFVLVNGLYRLLGS